MNRRRFIKSGALFVPAIFVPRLIRAQFNQFDPAFLANATARPAAAGGGPPSPGNIIQWLEADTIGGLSDGDPISTWAATTGKDATQAGSLRPIYKTGIQNSLAVARFTSADGTYTQTAAFDSSQAQTYTILLVVKNRDGVGGTYMDGRASCATRSAFKANVSMQFYAGSAFGDTSIFVDTSWHIYIIVVNGASSSLSDNGGSPDTLNADPGSDPIAGLTLGSDCGGFVPSDIDLGEHIIWSGTVNHANAFTYANTKWAVY